ncbi:CD209 antigen-like protein E [Mastacembelus armatus]|uniref:CD209 antigen-like protein E n=1 Tax=Mastacembelus armatus TaxID=205130 RepID=UPI000E461292|nr:CD209 antigen-like protein E [Mastacembelus armatus]
MDSLSRHLDDDAKEESPAAVTDAASGQTCHLAAGVVVALTTVTLVTVLLLSLWLCGFGTAPKVDQASTTSAMEQLQECRRERHDLTLMLHAVTQDSRCTLCPEGWLWWRRHCYFFSVGREDNRQWSESAEFCRQHNSSLAVIKDAAEMEFIQGVMRTFPKFPFLWVGLTDSRQEGQWLWWDGTDIQRYMPVTVEWDADHRDCADLRGGGSLFAADCEEYGPWACKRES